MGESVTLLFTGEPWDPEKKEDHRIALQNAFRLLKGQDGKSVSREFLLRLFEKNEVLKVIRRSAYMLKNHKPVQISERQCCRENCKKFFIEPSSSFECSSCGLLEWCSEGCAKQDSHNSEETAKSCSAGKPHEEVTRTRRARWRRLLHELSRTWRWRLQARVV